MLATLIAAKTLIIGVWFAIFFLMERVRKADTPPASPARLFRNAGMWLLTLLLSVSIVAPLAAWGANHLLWERPSWMFVGAAGALVLVIDLILLDCWTYWLHRAYHRIPVMWRLHEVHHRDEFLDTTSAVRFHFGEVALSATLRLIPITLLAIPLPTIILFEIVLLCAAVFHHSNVSLPKGIERVLSWFVVTPSIHWVHHHATWKDTHSNYATFLSLWDRLFRSRSQAERIPGMKIGVQDVEDKGFLALLLLPIRKADK